MALPITQIPCTTTPPTTTNLRRPIPTPTHFLSNPSCSSGGLPSSPARTLHIVSASKKTSRSSKLDTKNKNKEDGFLSGSSGVEETYEGYFLPELPGDEPDFWEGPEWEWLGFFMRYMWAFGILFAIISGGIAVATYNEGATDFKETPAYKESIQSRDLLEEPEASNSDVFESNPTEEAPSLE